MNWLFPRSPTAHRHGSGFWFCGCAGLPLHSGVMPEGGGGAAPQPGRAPVVLKGRRARTVDVHAHCYFQAAIDLMGEEAKGVLPPVKGVPEHFLQVEQQLDLGLALVTSRT